METPNEERTSGEPLMAPLEELERRAYAGQGGHGEDEPMHDDERNGALMPGPMTSPTTMDHPIAVPVSPAAADEVEEGDDDGVDRGTIAVVPTRTDSPLSLS